MSEYAVVLPLLQGVGYELKQLEGQMRGLTETACALGKSLSIRNLSEEAMRLSLNSLCSQMEQNAGVLRSYAEGLETCITRYHQAEKHIAACTDRQYRAERYPTAAHGGRTGSFGGGGSTVSSGHGGSHGAFDRTQSLWNASFEAEREHASWSYEGTHSSANASVGEAYAHGDANLQFTDTTMGVVLPSFGASMGAGFKTLYAEAEAGVGNSLLGASASGHVEAVSAEASARADARLFQDDGSFSPSLAASGTLEATLVEAAGQASGTFLGVTGSVQGSVSVGLGAHANIGYEEGVFSWDVGAALGVGASVGASIDLSETIETIRSGVDMVMDFAATLVV